MKLDPYLRYNLISNQSKCVLAERVGYHVGYHGNHEGYETTDDHVNIVDAGRMRWAVVRRGCSVPSSTHFLNFVYWS
jgi:hypothetical protein